MDGPSPSRGERGPDEVPLPDSRSESIAVFSQAYSSIPENDNATSQSPAVSIQTPPPALVTNDAQGSQTGPPSTPAVLEKKESFAARLMKSISLLTLSGDPNGIHTVPFPIRSKKRNTKPNYIRTTKYTVLTFLPLNLYFQFSRVYNVYFLLGALSTLGGTSSISPASMILPLLIVLLFSAIKDAYEDYVCSFRYFYV
jgi:hypothetical protein